MCAGATGPGDPRQGQQAPGEHEADSPAQNPGPTVCPPSVSEPWGSSSGCCEGKCLNASMVACLLAPQLRDFCWEVSPVQGGGQRQGGPTPFPVYQCVRMGKSGWSREGLPSPGTLLLLASVSLSVRATSDAKPLQHMSGWGA